MLGTDLEAEDVRARQTLPSWNSHPWGKKKEHRDAVSGKEADAVVREGSAPVLQALVTNEIYTK